MVRCKICGAWFISLFERCADDCHKNTEPLARGGVRASGKAMGEGSYYARTENLERRKHGKIVTKNEQKLLRKTNKVVTKSEQGAGGSQAILPRLSFQGYLLSRTH
jgi:hypothetical protein